MKKDKIDQIIQDLWKYPFDEVAAKYRLDQEVKNQFSNSINAQEYNFLIKVFNDFELMMQLDNPKFLVTTGFKKLQWAKINSLGIRELFKNIYIDEIDSTTRIFKKGLFQKILRSESKPISDYWVIGDNPISELKAGKELGLTTVQIAKFNQSKSEYSDYYISNYRELINLLK